MAEESQVRAFYAGKNIFITGGTGFVGVCLIEKILRCIPDVGKIYLLMRPKKGKEISERLQEFPKNPVFEKLLESHTTDIFQKLIPLAGDVGEENLGLSSEDRQTLVDNVNVVIHSAATLDFQEHLRPTVKINLQGTRRIMELCKEVKNLKVMVHVSSGYVNSFMNEAHEKVYETPEDPEKVISLVGTLSDDALLEIEPKLLKNHPNTYTFTKHLAEHEVVKCADLFPCTIVRPTMIVASWKEPIPGWTCSKVGPQGFLMGAAKGVVRRLPLCRDNISDYIPVDVVVNQLLVAGWEAAKAKSGLTVYHCSSSTCNPFRWSMIEHTVNGMLHKYPLKSAVWSGLTVYHCSSSTCNPFRWSMIEHTVNGMLHKYPLKSAVWYPHLKFMPSLLAFRISAIFVHFFPAILLDMMLRLTGGKPILQRLHKNVWKSLSKLEVFIFSQWKFYNPNTLELCKKLNSKDKELFYIDISNIYWEEYFRLLHLGVRRYLNREKEASLPAARKKDMVLLMFHVIWQLLIIGLLWQFFAYLTGFTLTQCAWIAPVIYILYTFL